MIQAQTQCGTTNKCKSDYIYANRTPDEKSKCRNLLADIYTDLYDYVQESVIDCHKPITTKSLYDNFMAICLSNKLGELFIPSHRTVVQHTLEHFKHGVKECLTSKREGSILYYATKDPDMVPYLSKGDHDPVFRIRSADYMREILMNVKKTCKPLPTALTSQDFSNGQAPIPAECIQFFRNILCSNPASPTTKESRLVMSMSSDLLYNVTKGHVKPAKHLCMGVGMKSLTGSEKVCDLLHKFGHSISCSQEKAILTEIGEEISRK